jgi:hypothetical protein
MSRLVFRHRAFGLDIASNRPLPGLPLLREAADGPAADGLRVTLGSLPKGTVGARCQAPRGKSRAIPADDASGLVVWQQPSGEIHLGYEDGAQFAVASDGGRVWAVWPDSLSVADAATYLLGPVMAFILRLRGILSLHAGVVAVENGAVALAGPPGSGKSMATAAFALQGFGVLSDDLAPVDGSAGRLLVRPTTPQIRLWEGAVEQLFGRRDALPLLTPTWDKRWFDAGRAGAFLAESLPLRAIYLLDPREDSREAPRLEDLSRREAFVRILGNLHTTRILPHKAQAALFDFARWLAEEVPVRRAIPHAAAAKLPAFCAMIAADARAAAPRPLTTVPG